MQKQNLILGMTNRHRIVHAIVTHYPGQIKYNIVWLGGLAKYAIDRQLGGNGLEEVSQHLTRIVALGVPTDAHCKYLGLVQQYTLALDKSSASWSTGHVGLTLIISLSLVIKV